MDDQYQSALALLQPYITDQAGVNVLSYPGTREQFSDNLLNMGAQSCIIHFALRFEGRLIDLDLLYYIVDIIRTTDGAVIFYSPESRVLDLKMITRPH